MRNTKDESISLIENSIKKDALISGFGKTGRRCVGNGRDRKIKKPCTVWLLLSIAAAFFLTLFLILFFVFFIL